MNNKIKSTFALIAFSLALFVGLAGPPSAQAQSSTDPVTLGGTAVSGGTNNLPALSTNVFDTVAITRGQYAAIQVRFVAPASSTSNAVIRIDSALDAPSISASTNWSQNVLVYPIAATGTTQITHVTNFTAGAVSFWRISASNTNAGGAFTNLDVRVSLKPGI